MRNHRPLVFTAFLAALSIMASARAQGAPTLTFTWNSCTGPVDRVSAGPGKYSLYATVDGLNEAHKAYEVWISVGDSQNLVPDAWRFDAAGCQGSSFVTADHLPPPAEAAACPALQGNEPSLQIKAVDLWPAVFGLPTTMLRLVVVNSYPSGILNPDPNQRYFAARFEFDHTFSVDGPGAPGVSCGGFETGLTFKDYRGAYLTMDGVEKPFVGVGEVTAHFNGGTPTPANRVTWGAIKNQYR